MSVGSVSRFVLRYKAPIAGAWLAIFVLAVAVLPWSVDRLSNDFSTPGTESADANAEILATYGNGANTKPLVPVVTVPDGLTVDSPGVREELDALYGRILEVRPEARVASWASTGDDAFVSADRRTTFGLVYLPGVEFGEGVQGVEELKTALETETVAGAPVLLTGEPVLIQVEDEGGAGVLIETLFGALGALFVLLYIFGSALAILPLLIAAVAIVTTFFLIGLGTSLTDINSVVQFLVALIGLGVAIDYALLVVTRWREERAAGHENEIAVQRAMETAGHAVVFSGTTVGIGLLALVFLPIPFFRGIGIGGMLIPLVSVIVTLTLLPIVLAKAGPRLDWPRFRRRKNDHSGWHRFATSIVRNRWQAAILGFVLLGALTIPALQLTIGSPRPDSLAGSGKAQLGLEALKQNGIDAGVLNPFEVVVHGDPAGVVMALRGVEGIRDAVAPAAWQQDGVAVVSVFPTGDGGGENTRAVLGNLRDVTRELPGDVLVGGTGAGSADFTDLVYSNFPKMVLLISAVTFVLLVRAFRSLILPIKALLLNGLSIGAAYGVLVLVWQWGWGSELIWGIPSTGSITDWVPIMTFAFLFGLSMDYEVFILHRMREEYDRLGTTDGAVIRGLAMTGKLVTCAALILFLAFVSMAATPETEIKIAATAIAAGIIIDVTIIRTLLVPALISLMDKWNWWLPGWLTWLAAPPDHLTEPNASPAD